MLKDSRKTLLLNLGYILLAGIFFVFVYYFTDYCCVNFFNRVGQASFDSQNGEPDSEAQSAADGNTASAENSYSGPIFKSFFDSFASGHLIDITRTNLYRDDTAAAVYFAPNYSFEKAAAEEINNYQTDFSSIYLNDFSEPLKSSDRRCLGDSCLEQSGIKLSYRGKPLPLPKEIKTGDIVAISIGSLEKRWLVGITMKDGVNYQGRVYFFDGKKLVPFLFPDKKEKIDSPYQGVFGFGGIENDFLVIYGAYHGMAYHSLNGRLSDVGKFFDFRVMAKGFRPEVIRAVNPEIINWYIFSSSLKQPRLLKLWTDKNGEIAGEAVYSDIFSDSVSSAVFKLATASESEFRLMAKIKTDSQNRAEGGEEWRVFSDRGFDNAGQGSLFLNPIPTEAAINIKKIANCKLGSADLPFSEGKFFFSTDNNEWRELPQGENLNLDFPVSVRDNFYLRVDFFSQANRFYSPYLAEILFDFYYQK